MAEKVYVGVSGFSYPSWKGTFYPKETKSEDFLGYYSQHLETVEINSSFYAPPRHSMVKSWSDRTDEKFRFAFKAPQLITHILKLGKGAADAANKFSERLAPLGERRGPILFQLPPYVKLDRELLTGFLAETSKVKNRVFEFRHESWLEDSTYRLLEENGTGFCIAETEDMEPVFRVTADLAYFRLRLDSYTTKAVDQWATRIRKTAGDRETYVYLRHDETGENAMLAQRLSQKLQVK